MLKRKCQQWVTRKIYSEKQVTYILRKVKKRDCAWQE